MRHLVLTEPIARSAVWSRRLAIFAVALTAVAIGLSRFHKVEPAAALTVFGAALAIALLAALLAATAAVVIWQDGLHGAGQAAVGLVLAAALLAYPAYLAGLAFALPRITQVSTDLESPRRSCSPRRRGKPAPGPSRRRSTQTPAPRSAAPIPNSRPSRWRWTRAAPMSLR